MKDMKEMTSLEMTNGALLQLTGLAVVGAVVVGGVVAQAAYKGVKFISGFVMEKILEHKKENLSKGES